MSCAYERGLGFGGTVPMGPLPMGKEEAWCGLQGGHIRMIRPGIHRNTHPLRRTEARKKRWRARARNSRGEDEGNMEFEADVCEK